MSVNIRNPITGELTNASGGVINPKSINEMIAPIEDGTASKAYAVGEQFIMNDLLCEATQAIAQGDTMVIGTNCKESEQLSKQVKDINTSLTANGNRFEAGYSSENDEYGFNIGSTFYPIGASSGGGDSVLELLDIDNAVVLTTTAYTAPKNGAIIGSNLLSGSSNNVTLTANGIPIMMAPAFSSPQRDNAAVYGIQKGTVLRLSGAVEPNQCSIRFFPYKYESISPEVTVYNEAEVTLDYANPLFTFTSGNLSYTATKTCWLVGDFHAQSGTLSINGIAYGIISSTDYTCSVMLKLSKGDTVAISQNPSANSLHVLEGTISGSVGHLGGALYPDYSRLIANPTGHSYTATKDCFLCGVGFVNGGDIGIFINGHCAFRQGDNIEILLHAGDVVTAGAPSTSYTFKQDGAYYTNSLGVFEIAD